MRPRRCGSGCRNGPREFSPENLEGLVKFAYFGGFIDMAGVRQLLVVEKPNMRQLLVKWYEEVREQGVLALLARHS